MSNNNKIETESPDIIEEIIPGKNNDYDDKSVNQQSFIENYNEEESAQAVIEVSEESKKPTGRNIDKAGNQTPHYVQTTTDIQEQTAQATREIAGNYLEFQRQAINSFQGVFMPYFLNVQNQLWNNQEFFKGITRMYSRLVSNYTEGAIAFSRMCNDIALTNACLFKNPTNKPNE